MRVYVESFGCAQNLGEGEAIERSLHAEGHAIAPGPEGAELGVLVGCAVIGPTEDRMIRRWEWLSARIPRIIVTGCLVPLRTDRLNGPGRPRTRFVPIREQSGIPALVREWASPEAGEEPPDSRAPTRPTTIAEVTIAQGCTSACSYCFSRLARGRLTSVPLDEVVGRIELAQRLGAIELRLSSLDTSCWGEDLPGAPGLPQLLWSLAELPGAFRVRVGMMSPQSLAPIAPAVWSALGRERFFRFVHLPVQSGSDEVLEAMHRGYRAQTFRSLVEGARRSLPDLMLSTDVIVGYPTEEERDFRASLSLLEEVEPEIVNVTRFSARPGTPAARLRPLPGRIVKERSRALAQLRIRIARRKMERWIGRTETAWVVEAGTPGTTIARLSNYLPVVVPRVVPFGETLPVRIDGARSNYLLGRPVAERTPWPAAQEG